MAEQLPVSSRIAGLAAELVDAANAGDTERMTSAVLCGLGLPRHAHMPGQAPRVVIYRYKCPLCKGTGYWSQESGEKCPDCQGFGLTNDVKGWDEAELERAPRPPAVMKSPCVDCAYRPGSPEEGGLDPQTPFFCHHGMHRLPDGGYESPAYAGSLPLGAMVCGGWWAIATDEELPDSYLAPYRDRSSSDRSESVPELSKPGQGVGDQL